MKCREMLGVMGHVVTVKQTFHRKYGPGGRRVWVVGGVTPRAGWVIGFRSLQNGQYVETNGYEPPHFWQESRVRCVLVVYWPTLNPVRVPLDGFELGGVPESPGWNDEIKRLAREESKNWPRDERGRWISEGG